MLIIQEPGRCRIDGLRFTCDQNSELILVPERWHQYRILADHESPGQCWIKVNLKDNLLIIHSRAYNILPLCYFRSDGLIILSHSAREVALAMKTGGMTIEPDRVGIWESFFFAMPLRRRTLYRNIEKTLMGESLTIHVEKGIRDHHQHWIPALCTSDLSREEAHEEAVTVLDEIEKDFEVPEKCLLPLSGGLDSRLLLSMLKRKGGDCRSFTFGSFGSAEVSFGRRVATFMDIPWEEIALEPEDYITCGNEVVDLTGGVLSSMHMHLYCCLKKLSPLEAGRVLINGYMGETLAGGRANLTNLDWDRETVFKMTLNLYFSPQSGAKKCLTDADHRAIIGDLNEILNACLEKNKPGVFLEYLSTAERNTFVAHDVCILQTLMPVSYPLAHPSFERFFTSLPHALRVNRNFFIEAVRRRDPELFSLPSTAFLFGHKVTPLLRKRILQGLNLFQYTTDFLTRGKYPIFNPFQYEQHRYLLNHHLKDELNKATDQLSSLLNCDLAPVVSKSLGFRHKNPTLGFAVMSAARAFNTL